MGGTSSGSAGGALWGEKGENHYGKNRYHEFDDLGSLWSGSEKRSKAAEQLDIKKDFSTLSIMGRVNPSDAVGVSTKSRRGGRSIAIHSRGKKRQKK